MSSTTIGNLAGLAAALLWAFSAIRFLPALKRYGPFQCNFFKAALGSLLFFVTVLLMALFESLNLPSTSAGAMLFVSGVIGMAIGDFALFAAMDRIGPRQATLIHATAPIFLLILSLLTPHESLELKETIGVILVVVGVIEVTMRQKRRPDDLSRNLAAGTAWGLVAALGQAIGIVLAKDALEECDKVVGALYRLVGATIGLGSGMLLIGRGKNLLRIMSDKAMWRITLEPTVVGTYLGVTCMMVAIGYGKAAVAGALISLTPVFLVPLSIWMLRERFDARLLVGTLIAFAGVILMGS